MRCGVCGENMADNMFRVKAYHKLNCLFGMKITLETHGWEPDINLCWEDWKAWEKERKNKIL